MMAFVVVTTASCVSEMDETEIEASQHRIQLVVDGFPAFGESTTRAIGTPDVGKTSWTEGDELLLAVTSAYHGDKYAVFTYNGETWTLTSGELYFRDGDIPVITHVYYAPNYEWSSGELELKEGKVAGTDECIEGTGTTTDGVTVTVSFSSATQVFTLTHRDGTQYRCSCYSRDFIPANGNSAVNNTYTLTSDADGNVFLYGNFTMDSSIEVKYGENSLVDYTFTESTKDGISYALDATFTSAVDLKPNDIMEMVKKEMQEGRTDFKIILAPNAGEEELKAITSILQDASVNLTITGITSIPEKGFSQMENLQSIRLPDVTELGAYAFEECSNIKTIEAPKLEKINNGCFRNCDYLQKLVFGTITRVDDTDGLLIPNNSRNTIDLVLSEQQKLLTNDGHGIWTPATSDERYSGSSESNKNQFFGYIFKSIRFK
ncbi:MAG: leucine-rich repeat protein [Butyricimonas faecalis]